MRGQEDKPSRRGFRYGRVEFAILGVVSLVIANSAYQLISGTPDVVFTSSSHLAPSSHVGEQAESYETKCKNDGEMFVTTAARIRITGPYCGAPVSEPSFEARSLASETAAPRLPEIAEPQALAATHLSSLYSATVFKDSPNKRFSTDFIPVGVGNNKIRMEFVYPSLKPVHIEVNVERKEKD